MDKFDEGEIPGVTANVSLTLSYSRRRDRIISVLLRGYYKGGGYKPASLLLTDNLQRFLVPPPPRLNACVSFPFIRCL